MQLKLNNIQMIVKSLQMMEKAIQEENQNEDRLNKCFMYKEKEIHESIQELLCLDIWLKNGNTINIKF